MPRRGQGRQWEEVCDNSRNVMQKNGLCHWFRLQPPVLKVGVGTRDQKGSFLAVYTGKGPPDWVMLTGGVSILGDDKDCKKAPWRSSQVKPHQANDFDLHERQGGIACVLLRMDDKSRWVIPWSRLKPLWKLKKSLCLYDIQQIGMPWASKEARNKKTKKIEQIPYDWLTPLLEFAREENISD